MSCCALDRNGDSLWNPTPKQRRTLLASLTPGDALACVTLVLDGQWSLSAFHSGLVNLENAGAGEGPWHMTGIPVTRILELWQLLADGNVQDLRRLDWLDGTGV